MSELRVLRMLELSVRRRLDGLLQGDHAGLRTGLGSEPDETRPFADKGRAADRWLLDTVRLAWRARILVRLDIDLRMRLRQAAKKKNGTSALKQSAAADAMP